MDRELRRFFDKQVDFVLKRLPEQIHKLLEEIPLYVEDRPSRRLRKEMNLPPEDQLCGCFVGRTIEQKYADGPMDLGFIAVFRETIYDMVLDEDENVDITELREEIRITILHELAHYHGMGEEEIESLGYG